MTTQKLKVMLNITLLQKYPSLLVARGRRVRDRGFTTTCGISAYHH